MRCGCGRVNPSNTRRPGEFRASFKLLERTASTCQYVVYGYLHEPGVQEVPEYLLFDV